MQAYFGILPGLRREANPTLFADPRLVYFDGDGHLFWTLGNLSLWMALAGAEWSFDPAPPGRVKILSGESMPKLKARYLRVCEALFAPAAGSTSVLSSTRKVSFE
jgi:hypothetical protein